MTTAYEILLMLDPELAEERQSEIVARMRELIEKRDGTWNGQEPWGRRRLAYEIDHKGEGVYHLLTFDCEPATLDEVSRVLKIDDTVMRHMATRRPTGSSVDAGLSQPPPPEPVAVTAPAREDVADDPVVASESEEAAEPEAELAAADEPAEETAVEPAEEPAEEKE